MDKIKVADIPRDESGRPLRTEFSKVWNGFENGIEQYYSQQRNTSNTVRYCKNMTSGADIGAIEKRNGYVEYGNQGVEGKAVLGLHQMQPYDVDRWRQLRVLDGDGDTGSIQYYDNGVWIPSGYESVVTGSKANFINFRERCYCFHEGLPVSWNGNTAAAWLAGASGYLDGCESALYPLVYNSRIFTAGSLGDPDKGQYSVLPTSSDWGVNTFPTTNTFYSLDGNAFTGISKTPKGDRAILFTYDNCFLGLYNDSDLIFEQYLISEYGTSSHRSIVNYGVATFWFHPEHGFIRYVAGEKVTVISNQIQRIVAAINPSFYGEVSGTWYNNSIYWSIGDISYKEYDGRTVSATNCILKYNVDESSWWLYSMRDEVSIISRMRAYGESQKLYFGNYNASVFNMEVPNVYSDNGQSIECELVTKRFYGETNDHPYMTKRFYRLQGITTSPSMKVQVRTDKQCGWGENKNSMNGKKITEAVFSSEINDIQLGNGLEGDYAEVRVIESSKDFCGLEHLKLDYKVIERRRGTV